VKANRGQIERALNAPTADIRLFLLYGPDESGSRALAERLERAMGADAERIDLEGSDLKGDPARLADEAASISLFGGARHIRVAPAGDECLGAVEALLGAERAGNPAVLIAGGLKATSKLLQLGLASPAAMVFASYPPEGQEADRLAMAMARDAGLRLDADAAARLARAAGSDRAVLAREIEKLALYLDAAPDRPSEAGHDALDAIGADAGESDLSRMVEAVMGGRPDGIGPELARLAQEGIDGIALLRALLRRLHLLIQLRAEVERGATPDAVIASAGKSLFWKEKDAVTRQLRMWPAARLATALGRVLDAERAVKSSASAGPMLVDAELIAISRVAARLR